MKSFKPHNTFGQNRMATNASISSNSNAFGADLNISATESRSLSSQSATPMSAVAAANATWETLRKQAQQLEGEIDARLVSFSKLASSFNNRGAQGNVNGSDRVSDTTALQIEDLLRKLSDLVESMNRSLEDMGPSASSAMMHTLQRHRDILFDYSKEFKKTKTNINSAREHAELLQSVRDDINSYKSQTTRSENLLSERESLDRSHKIADQLIDTVFATRNDLTSQRNTVVNSSSRIVQVASRLPVIGGLISRISQRKKRDNIILGGVIAVCIILLLLYMFA